MWHYILNISTVFLALLYLAKDWEAHKTSWRRAIILLLIIISGIGGVVNNYYTSKDNDDQHKADQEHISGLKVAVETAKNSQEKNTEVFVDALGKLSGKVSDLQSKVDTEELKKKADQLKQELDATRKALVSPKATLTYSFSPDPNIPALREIKLPVDDDVVHVTFYVRNDSDVPALDGELTVVICKLCKFKSEPPSFGKFPGAPETQRISSFGRILAKAHLVPLSVDIIVPPKIDNMQFAISYRCSNCIIPVNEEIFSTVYLSRY